MIRNLDFPVLVDVLAFQNALPYPYSTRPQKLDIREIEFKTSACFGGCPVFHSNIQANRKASYNVIRFNKEKSHFSAIYRKKIKIKFIIFLEFSSMVKYDNSRLIMTCNGRMPTRHI